VIAGGERMQTAIETYIERIGWIVVALAGAVGGLVWLGR
jgi:hypothetical protein